MASASRTSQVQTSFQDLSVNAMRWDEEMSKADASVSKSDLNALVFEYLLIEGFSEAAVELARETGLPYDVNHELIQERIQIREAVEDGRVEEAVRRVNELDPEILDTNPPLLFHLHLLRLIELIRSEKIDEALQFATNELAPRGAENPEFLADLERTMALLAFPDLARFADDADPSSHGGAPSRPAPDASTLELLQDPAFVPISSLMRRNQRVKVAKELNAAILESQGQGSETKLSGLVRLMSWGEEKARNAGIKISAVSDRASQSWADQVLALEAA